jgi:hypothetical protein
VCIIVPVNFGDDEKVFCRWQPKILKIKTSSQHCVLQQGLLDENRQVHDIVSVNFGDDEKMVR